MQMDLSGFNVAAIYSEDLEKSVSFYLEVLGFKKIDNVGGGVHLKLERGEKSLMIYIQDGYPRDERASGNSKISLSFNSPSVKSAYELAQKLGLAISMSYREVGSEFAMLGILDPSGNQIMLMGHP
jgi:predicted enzyme related to lactoylglutathione lyase